MKKSRTGYSVINITAGFAGYILNAVLGYVCRVVFVHFLTVDYLGVNGLFFNLLSMLSVAELGISSAIGFALYKPLAEGNKEKISSLMVFYGKAYRVIGTVVAALGIAMIPFLKLIIKNPPNISENLYLLYSIFLFNTVIAYFFSYRTTLLCAAQQNYLVVGISYGITIAESIIQIPVLFLTHNYLLYLIIQSVGSLAYNIIVSSLAKKKFPYIADKNAPELTKPEKKSLAVNIKALTLDKIAIVILGSTDNIVITYFKGLISVGYVSNYTLLVTTLGSLINQIFSSITSSVGNLNATVARERQYSFFKTLNLSCFWLYAWGAIGTAFVSNDIVKLCFGSNYVLGISVPLILGANFFIAGVQNAAGAYVNTLGLFKHVQYIVLVTAAINLILDIVLGKYFGIIGIYAATGIARLMTNAWYCPYAVFKYGFKKKASLYFKKYFEYIIVVVASGAVCYFLCSLCNFNIVVNVILKLVICSVIPNGAFYLLYHRTPEGKEVLAIIRRVVKKVLNIFKRKKATAGAENK